MGMEWKGRMKRKGRKNKCERNCTCSHRGKTDITRAESLRFAWVEEEVRKFRSKQKEGARFR